MTERDRRRQARMERGATRAKQTRQPTRRELEEGAHLLDCDEQHGRGERCNDRGKAKQDA